MSLADSLEQDDENKVCGHFYRISYRVWKEMFSGKIDRDDGVQQAVLECWKRRAQFDPSRASAMTFFFRVACSAMNAHYRWLNRKKRRFNYLSLDTQLNDSTTFMDLVPDPCDPPDRDLMVEEEIVELDRRLERLNPRERKVIERRFWDGHKLKEIAVDLGVCAERVRQIQNKALDKLRKPQ